MIVKPGVVVGFGLGYLLGTRAGRDRYEAIMRQFRAVQERPEVQTVAGVVSAQVSQIGRRVREAAGRAPASDTMTARVFDTPHLPSSNGSGAVTRM
jgi:hypothetical protein